MALRRLGWCGAVTILGGITAPACGGNKWIGDGEQSLGGFAGNVSGLAGSNGEGAVGGDQSLVAGASSAPVIVGGAGGSLTIAAGAGGEQSLGGSAGGGQTVASGAGGQTGASGASAAGSVSGAQSIAAGAGGVLFVAGGAGGVSGAQTGAGGVSGGQTTTAGVGGALSIVGGSAGAGGAPVLPTGPCAGLDGEWTVSPTVTTRANAGALLPQVGQRLNSLGLRFAATEDGGCHAEFLPDWSPPFSLELVNSAGKLVLPDTYKPVAMYAPLKCRSSISDWMFKLLAIDGAGAHAFHWDAEVKFLPLGFDSQGTATYSLDGNLTPGLPALQWSAYRNVSGPRDWCSVMPVATALTDLLPWEKVNVHYSQPVGVNQATLSSTIDEQTVAVSWALPGGDWQRQITDNKAPTGFNWEQRRLAGAITNWDQIVGKTLLVQDATHALGPLTYSFASLPLAKNYVGADLRQLAAHGTAEFGTFLDVEGLHVINLAGSMNALSSRDILYAAGRLDVAGKSKTAVQLRVPTGNKVPDTFVEAVDHTGVSLRIPLTKTVSVTVSGIPPIPLYEDRTYELALSGQSELGIVVNQYDDAGNMGMQVNFTIVSITTE